MYGVATALADTGDQQMGRWVGQRQSPVKIIQILLICFSKMPCGWNVVVVWLTFTGIGFNNPGKIQKYSTWAMRWKDLRILTPRAGVTLFSLMKHFVRVREMSLAHSVFHEWSQNWHFQYKTVDVYITDSELIRYFFFPSRSLVSCFWSVLR